MFGDFGKSARLPEGETVTIEPLPESPGTYELACQMGMTTHARKKGAAS